MESLRSALGTETSFRSHVASMGQTPFQAFQDEGVWYHHMTMPPIVRGVKGISRNWRHKPHDRQHIAEATILVDSIRPDLIHVHGSEGPFGLLAVGAHVPVLVSLQGILRIYSKVYFAGIPRAEVLRDLLSMEFVKGRGLVHASWNMRLAARRELRILQSCHFFAGRTDWDRSVLGAVNRTALYYEAEEVLRPAFYDTVWQPEPDGALTIYSTCGPAPYKGLLNLLAAAAQLNHSLRQEIRLRISGKISGSPVWQAVARAVKRLNLEDMISWLGPLG